MQAVDLLLPLVLGIGAFMGVRGSTINTGSHMAQIGKGLIGALCLVLFFVVFLSVSAHDQWRVLLALAAGMVVGIAGRLVVVYSTPKFRIEVVVLIFSAVLLLLTAFQI